MIFSLLSPVLTQIKAIPGGELTQFLLILTLLSIVFQVALMAILKILQFIVGKTTTTLDDRILKAVRPFLPIIAALTGLWMSIETVAPTITIINKPISEAYIIGMLGTAAFLISAIADAVLIWYGIEIRPNKKSIREDEVFPFVRNVVKIGIIVLFLVFILQRLGFDTTAIITGLGVGGLAVALALQDTLGNFFGGVHILVDKPFREEDYVKMDNGIEGVIKQIGWRTTKINTFPTNNLIIVPNSKIANSILENFSYPNEKTGIVQTIGVDYKEDVEQVETILLDTLLKTAEKTNGIIDKESVWVRFDSFGDFSLNFKYGYLVNDWSNKGSASRSTNKAIFYAFKENNINIPFPVRTIHNPINITKVEEQKKTKK